MPRLLVIEDNTMNREMLQRLLEMEGYDVVVGADGLEAIALTRAHCPDLILMDMSLPVLDGWEATRRIKSDENIRQTPIIALTAHAMVGDREKALAAGCDDYDTKPVDIDRLNGKIAALLED